MDKAARAALLTVKGIKKKRAGFDQGGTQKIEYGSKTGFPELDRIITGVGNLNKMFNPVEAAGQSMEASKRMFAPDTSGWARIAAAGDMLTGMAGAALPFASVARPAVATAREVKPLVEGFDAYQGSPHNFSAERLVRMPDGSTQHIVGAPDALPDIPVGAQVLQDYPLGRMRMDKIGTGEGNQSYGYGLYGAETEDVARTYRDTLSQNNKFTPYVTYKAEEFLKNAGGDYQKAADAAKQQLTGNLDSQQAHEISEVARLLDAKSVSNGRMYHIRVKADPNDFINYDAPFHKQPKNVQDFFSHMAADQPHGKVLAKSIQTPEHAANAAKAGIPGVKFLDQGSRLEGAGTRNYVMFDDKPINILRKYEYGGRAGKSKGGALDLARAVMAKNRAGGQIAPSKYLPNVPRAVHAGGGDVEGDDDDGITAYHGSAYDFPQFDIRKLGTGTGHQAKGHGLYFAGDENDAKNYREMLKDNGSIDIEHESHKLGIPLDRDAQADLRSVSRNVNGDSTLAAKALQARNLAARAMPQEKLADLIDRHRKSTTGHMYKVKLNVKPEELLDWDKPLSEQHPNVQAALSRTMPDYTIKNMAGMPHAFANGKMIEVNPNGLTGRDAYVLSRMGKSTEGSSTHQDAKAASEHLLSEGIKGIRYRETGTHNYVMFHHDPVQVVDKYEYGGPVGKAGGGEVVNLGKEKLVRSITKAASDVKSGAHQERMDQRAHKLHESGHLPLPIGTKVTPPQGWDMPSELHIHGYWQDILHPEQHGYKLKSENGDLYEVQHQMHSGQNPYVFGGGFKAYSGPVRNRAGYSDEAMAHRNPILPTRTPEQSDQLNKEYDQLFGTEPDITKAEGGRIHAEGGGKMELRSKAAEAIRNQAQLKGGVDQLLAVTAKGKGVKQAELTNAGRPSGNIISKEELAKHFEDAMPQVSVERLGGADSNKYTRFEDFFLPGGKQYREHLLTLQGRENQAPYIYPWHWPDHKNVIAHIRMADRDNGETLHVGEVQSDWGQQARQRGFYDPTKPFRVYDKETKETKKLASNQFEARDEAIKSGSGYAIEPSINHHPPTGPYVGDTQQWTDLALKHILTEAAKGGHKRIVFSPGEHSADMYGQRQSAASLSLHRNPEGSNTLGTLAPYDADGFLTASGFTPVKDEQGLVDLIGKEHAAKLLASPIKSLPRSNMRVDQWQQGDPAPEPTHTLTEPDMHIGGQGMINYYQRNVNAGTLKLLRQHDPSIQSESYDLPSDPEVANGKGYKGFSLPMTDTARQSILKNGFGAFKRGGTVGKEEGGALGGNPEYSTGHTAPHPEEGGMLHDPDAMFPDISTHGRQYYGTGADYDHESFDVVSKARHQPSAPVFVYRAVSHKIKDPQINAGDWVTTSPSYAKEHGEANVGGKYKILKKRVRADELATNGDSIHEWGYWPKDEGRPMLRGLNETREEYEVRKQKNIQAYKNIKGYKASGGGVDSALALTRRFTKDGTGATMALKSKGK